MLKCKLLFQTFTYLGWESSIKYLGGNQIEHFTLTYTHIHTETHTYMHTHTFSDAIYITDMQQTYIKDITVNCKDIILRSLLWKRLLDSGNCMNLSEIRVIRERPKKFKFEVEYFPFQVFMPAILVTFSCKKWIYFTRTMYCKFNYIQ